MNLSSREKAELAVAENRAGLNPERILLFETLVLAVHAFAEGDCLVLWDE